jgi:hypothetical protein
VFETAEDWMLHHLGSERPLDREPGEFLPGDPAPFEDDPAAKARAARGTNPVIRMQQYLNLFSGVEKEFSTRAALCISTPASEQDRMWAMQVEAPLLTFADVIARESSSATRDPETVFKLGELLLLARRLTHGNKKPMKLVERIERGLPARHREPLLNEYLKLCHEEART